MLAPRPIDADAVPPQRWRNGSGMTRELLAWPTGDNWQFRISLADIDADGPFSAFPGVERWFVVLAGAGVELNVGGTLHRLRPGDAPLRFDGAAATGCRLIDGPTRDLNLMLRHATGALRVAEHASVWHPAGGRCGLFAARAGVCHHDHGATPLRAGSLLWFDDPPASLRFDASAPTGPAIGSVGSLVDTSGDTSGGTSGGTSTRLLAGTPVGWWLTASPLKGPA